jgi:hypothetical protein
MHKQQLSDSSFVVCQQRKTLVQVDEEIYRVVPPGVIERVTIRLSCEPRPGFRFDMPRISAYVRKWNDTEWISCAVALSPEIKDTAELARIILFSDSIHLAIDYTPKLERTVLGSCDLVTVAYAPGRGDVGLLSGALAQTTLSTQS